MTGCAQEPRCRPSRRLSRSRSSRCPRRGAAFTLLEVLAALLVVSVLVLAVYSSMRIAITARDRARAAIEPVRAAELALAAMQADLLAAMPPTGLLAGAFSGQDEAAGVVADGPSDVLTMHAATGAVSHVASEDYDREQTTVGGDIQMIEWQLTDPDASGLSALVRRVSRNLLSPSTPEATQQVLCRDVRMLNFRYYDGTEWLDEWDSAQHEDSLPIAVEVTLELGDPQASRQATADLTTPQRATRTADLSERPVYSTKRVMLLPCTRLSPETQMGLTP